MKKKLLAVAVASALVAPAAFAQTATPFGFDIGWHTKIEARNFAKTFAKKSLTTLGKAWTRLKTAHAGATAAIAAKIRAMKASARNAAGRRTVGFNHLFAPAACAF